MVLFVVSRYEMPDQKDVDMDQARHNMRVFLSDYLSARCKVGQPREPKITASFSLIPPSTVDGGHDAEQILIQQEEFDYLHKLFVNRQLAVSADANPDDVASPALDYYNAGNAISYDSYIMANGFAWISYIAGSGKRRYVVVGPDDGRIDTTLGRGFFN